jgi:hypothetical protein
MRRSVSADSILSKNKILPLVIKTTRSKEINKYKSYVLISGTIFMSCYTISNDMTYEIIGAMLTTGYFTVNLGFSYVENYLNQLDRWRLEEARYEEKTDPPEWNWKIINQTSHLAIILSLLACICELDNQYYYLGNGLQIISIGLKIKNDNSFKMLLVCSMDFLSVLLFIINKYIHSTAIVCFATYIYIISEIIST